MEITLQIIVCILIADFLTGFFHWVEDTYGDPNFPILGKYVFQPNILHHEFPTLMTKMAGLFTTNWQSVTLALFGCFVVWVFGGLYWQVILTFLIASSGNQIHCWNHEAKVRYLVQWLKDSGLIQTQKMHSQHHIPPYDKCYCVLINFNNAWLDRVNFWRKLEWLLDKFGLKVKRGLPERNGY